MRVTGMNRSGSGDVPYVEQIHPTQSLTELLPDADAVVVTLPLTDQTHNMIDGAALSRMRTGAVLVNVGRGGVVDEPALIAALAAGRLGWGCPVLTDIQDLWLRPGEDAHYGGYGEEEAAAASFVHC